MNQSTYQHNPDLRAAPVSGGTRQPFARVFLPTDPSSCAERTIDLIGRLPNPGAACLFSSEFPTNGAAETLWKQQRTLVARGWSVSVLSQPALGTQAYQMVMRAGRQHASAIIVGGHRRSLIRELLLRNPVQNLLKQNELSLLVAPYRDPSARATSFNDARPLLERVLCPVDFDPVSEEVLALLPHLDGIGTVILLHVIAPGKEDEARREAVVVATHRLLAYQALLETAGIEAEPFVVIGDLGTEVRRVAVDEGATLILLTRRGSFYERQDGTIGSMTVDLAESASVPVLVRHSGAHYLPEARELAEHEFEKANDLWRGDRQQTVDPARDRVFGTLIGDRLVSVARCRPHPDGAEVDAIFTISDLRKMGYARLALDVLVNTCDTAPLFVKAEVQAESLFRSLGFSPIAQGDLPHSAGGENNAGPGAPLGTDTVVFVRQVAATHTKMGVEHRARSGMTCGDVGRQ